MTAVSGHGGATWSARSVVVYLIGTAGLAASLTLVFFGMRAVMDVGGACADGGPYVSAQPCPEGAPLLMFGGILGLFGFGGLMAWTGMSLGARYGCLVALAWPALFLSLGWNFLEYAFRPPDGSGEVVLGWLVPGVVFVLMGGGPLLAMLPLRGGRESTAERRRALTASLERRTHAGTGPQTTPARVVVAGTTPATASIAQDLVRVSGGADTGELVSQLERLAALRDGGHLTDPEFRAAKAKLLGADEG